MTIRIPLPSRASDPAGCRECDEPCGLARIYCDDCATAPFLQRVEWRYQNDEGIHPLLDHEADNRHITVQYEFHPLSWRLGVEVELDHVSAAVVLMLGPWSLWASWSS